MESHTYVHTHLYIYIYIFGRFNVIFVPIEATIDSVEPDLSSEPFNKTITKKNIDKKPKKKKHKTKANKLKSEIVIATTMNFRATTAARPLAPMPPCPPVTAC